MTLLKPADQELEEIIIIAILTFGMSLTEEGVAELRRWNPHLTWLNPTIEGPFLPLIPLL